MLIAREKEAYVWLKKIFVIMFLNLLLIILMYFTSVFFCHQLFHLIYVHIQAEMDLKTEGVFVWTTAQWASVGWFVFCHTLLGSVERKIIRILSSWA